MAVDECAPGRLSGRSEAAAGTTHALALAFGRTDALARLTHLREMDLGRIVFTTSFGLEDQVLTHLIVQAKLSVAFVTLDTGRLFPEIYDLWAQTETRYGIVVRPFYPRNDALELFVRESGINAFYGSRDARKTCCDIRKVEPLGRALAGADVWITGLRADQSAARGDAAFAEADAARGLIKLNPLLDWSRERTAAFAQAQDVPLNPLHGRGFVSIGCQPCTRAIGPGEPERAGRWWWEDDAAKECGLHVGTDGTIRRAAVALDETRA